MSDELIPFSRPFRAAGELRNLEAVLASGHVHGDGAFTRSATERLSRIVPSSLLLTTSGTHALEMASILLDLGPGDEVILPSFTFASAATAVAIAGATPVFVDSEPETGNVDPQRVAAAITSRTRAISVVHYGGVAADVDALSAIAEEHGLPVIEDNAHGLGAAFGDRPLGTWGALAAQSFHDTKNIHCGEGGALIVNDPRLMERAEIIREKGTDRSKFLRGQVDKYTWVDVGSSYLMSELNAAVLDAQLEEFGEIQGARLAVWERYAAELAGWADEVGARVMRVPEGRVHPAHVFYLLMPSAPSRDELLRHARAHDVVATFHYVPLDDSPAGRRLGRTPEECVVAHDFSSRLVRLPLWAGMAEWMTEKVVDVVRGFRPDAA